MTFFQCGPKTLWNKFDSMMACSPLGGVQLLPPSGRDADIRSLGDDKGWENGAWDEVVRRSIGCNAGVVPDRCGEEGSALEGKALDLPVGLRSSPHPCSLALGCDWKNEIMDTSSQNEFGGPQK